MWTIGMSSPMPLQYLDQSDRAIRITLFHFVGRKP